VVLKKSGAKIANTKEIEIACHVPQGLLRKVDLFNNSLFIRGTFQFSIATLLFVLLRSDTSRTFSGREKFGLLSKFGLFSSF
jgi:hypothetical protein